MGTWSWPKISMATLERQVKPAQLVRHMYLQALEWASRTRSKLLMVPIESDNANKPRKQCLQNQSPDEPPVSENSRGSKQNGRQKLVKEWVNVHVSPISCSFLYKLMTLLCFYK